MLYVRSIMWRELDLLNLSGRVHGKMELILFRQIVARFLGRAAKMDMIENSK